MQGEPGKEAITWLFGLFWQSNLLLPCHQSSTALSYNTLTWSTCAASSGISSMHTSVLCSHSLRGHISFTITCTLVETALQCFMFQRNFVSVIFWFVLENQITNVAPPQSIFFSHNVIFTGSTAKFHLLTVASRSCFRRLPLLMPLETWHARL